MEPPAEPDRKRFPLLDSEEPPRSWQRRLAIPAAVIVVVLLAAGCFAVVRSLTHKAPSSTASAPAISAPGRIAVITKDQDLVVSRPNGTHIVKIPSLDQAGQFVTPALDNRYLSLGDGEVAAATGRLPAMIHTKIYPFANGMQGANGAPFADHDQELLALTPNNYGPYTDNQASEISLATGRSISFGTADTIAGDPQARGMFVSVGARVPLADQTKNQNLPDARVELRDARRPAVLLATAGMLNRDLGQPADLRVSLYPEPNPARQRGRCRGRAGVESPRRGHRRPQPDRPGAGRGPGLKGDGLRPFLVAVRRLAGLPGVWRPRRGAEYLVTRRPDQVAAVPRRCRLRPLLVVTRREVDSLRRSREPETDHDLLALGDRKGGGRAHDEGHRPRHARHLAAVTGRWQRGLSW